MEAKAMEAKAMEAKAMEAKAMEAKAMEADMTWSHDTPQSMRRLAAMLACVVAMSSMPAGAEGPVVQPSQPADPGGGFVDVTGEIGLLYPVIPDEQEKEIGAGRLEDGGLALADIDGDGRLDLHVSHGRSETGRLFSWDGRRFAARAGNGGIAPAAMDRAGYFIDLDEDGAPDFLSIHQGGVQALRNDGRGQFTPMPASFATSSAEGFDGHYSIAAGDYDSDGDLDLIFTRWGRIASGFKIPFQRLWRNDGRGRFEDVSHVVPIRTARTESTDAPAEFSFTPTFSDIDGDGDPDLLLAGDFGTSQVLRNDGGRGFTDIRDAVISDENGMGAAVGDYDHDGDMDWFVTSIHDPGGGSGFGPTGNRLYRNRGDGRFEDATDRTGVRAGGWGWGACLADFDNDGHPDIFHTNGYGELVGHGELAGRLVGRTADADWDYTPFLDDPSRLFMADGDGTFTERASRLGVRHTGQGRVSSAPITIRTAGSIFSSPTTAPHRRSIAMSSTTAITGWPSTSPAGTRIRLPSGPGSRCTRRRADKCRRSVSAPPICRRRRRCCISVWAPTGWPGPSRCGGPARKAGSPGSRTCRRTGA